MGEYYLPCLPYPSNSISLSEPFRDEAVLSALESWHTLHERIASLPCEALPRGVGAFLSRVTERSPEDLKRRSHTLHEIIGDRVTVLPPDTRHVDYEVIPVIAADGCLYRCGFCRVKSGRGFSRRTRDDILRQIHGLRAFYGPDISNYNSVFLGQHDALHAGADLTEFAAKSAYDAFGFARSTLRGANLFLFGSVDSLLGADWALFDRLEALPYSTYINIGFESADRETLSLLGKAVTPASVEEALARMVALNRKYETIEITANFVFGGELPQGHLPSIFRVFETRLDPAFRKGTFYFSPLFDQAPGDRRHTKRDFYKIKAKSILPTYLYLIQRL